MQSIIYDVAVSIDGYIAGPDGDISQFAHEGPVVDDYFERLSTYSCAIMGRATYEFGYRFGLKPGQNPYPHLEVFVFSDSIVLPEDAEVSLIGNDCAEFIRKLRITQPKPIYLCGGGKFAGALLANNLIDTLRLKRAPVILGSGTRLFDSVNHAHTPVLSCEHTKHYNNGYVFQELRVQQP